MITLTLDPKLFDDPMGALLFLQKKIGQFLQRLSKVLGLKSWRYARVMQFQQNGMPHVHVLVDATTNQIPASIVREMWNNLCPKQVGNRNSQAAKLGSVHVGDMTHPRGGTAHEDPAAVAAHYVLRSNSPIPAWLMDAPANFRVRTLALSRGLVPTVRVRSKVVIDSFAKKGAQPRRPVSCQTIGQRVKACSQSFNILRLDEICDVSTGEVFLEKRWAGEVRNVRLPKETMFSPDNGQIFRWKLHATSIEEALQELRPVTSDLEVIRSLPQPPQVQRKAV